jgi:hypothetical protein
MNACVSGLVSLPIGYFFLLLFRQVGKTYRQHEIDLIRKLDPLRTVSLPTGLLRNPNNLGLRYRYRCGPSNPCETRSPYLVARSLTSYLQIAKFPSTLNSSQAGRRNSLTLPVTLACPI